MYHQSLASNQNLEIIERISFLNFFSGTLVKIETDGYGINEKDMNIPTRNRHWIKEIKKAYSSAEKRISCGEIERFKVYLLAPEYVAKNRNIDSADLIERMIQSAKSDVAYEQSVDPDAEHRYKYHFVSAYIFGHVELDLLTEKECDKIMNYINEEWDLFDGA